MKNWFVSKILKWCIFTSFCNLLWTIIFILFVAKNYSCNYVLSNKSMVTNKYLKYPDINNKHVNIKVTKPAKTNNNI